MKNPANQIDLDFFPRYGVLCFGFFVVGQPTTFPRGTGGPQVPQVIFRTVVPLSMLAYTLALHHFIVTNSAHKTKKQNNAHLKTKHSTIEWLQNSPPTILRSISKVTVNGRVKCCLPIEQSSAIRSEKLITLKGKKWKSLI